jgi:o-succinylbenzoate synthase
MTSRTRISVRRGWLVHAETADGWVGHGDCAPLPEAGTETLERAAAALDRAERELIPSAVGSALERLDGWLDTPAARCGLETAMLDNIALRHGVTVARLLSPSPRDRVAVNGSLGLLDGESIPRAARAVESGYRILKLKVGRARPALDLARLGDLAATLPPDISLRLDANGAWDLAEALAFVRGAKELPIESLEEPLSTPSFTTLRQLQDEAPWSLALDESVPAWPREELLGRRPVRRLVLKPMSLGGVGPALELARGAACAGLESVVTSTLDSAVGVRAAVHLAAAIGNDLAHGLGTSSWLAQDLAPPPRVAAGVIALGDTPGLGSRPGTPGDVEEG